MHPRNCPVVLVLLLAAAGCNRGEAGGGGDDEPSAETSQATRVETLALESQRFTDVIELTGSVEAIHDATLSAQTAGKVASIEERGAVADEGATVARIDASQARVAVQQARAQVAAAESRHALAQDTYERMKPLHRDSIISAQEFEKVQADHAEAQANLNQAKAALAQARESLGDTRVTTPFAGTVEERFVDPGEQVAPGEPMLRVVNTRRVKVTAGVPERHANHIELGTSVDLAFRAGGGEPHTAEVTFVGGVIDPETRTFPIEVEIDNASRRIKPQMVVQLRVTREVVEDALLIPRTAVVRDETGTSVYTVETADGGEVAKRRGVTLGSGSGDRVVVREGLNPGARVIIAGADDVADGDPVRVVSPSGSTETAQPPNAPGAEAPEAPAPAADRAQANDAGPRK